MRLPFGPKQCPAIYQRIQDDLFGAERKVNGDQLAYIFVDDTYIGDKTLDEHYQSMEQLLTKARSCGIQYRFIKCQMFMPTVTLLGFCIGNGGRYPDPKKTKQLREWPPYTSCADVISHLFFAS